MTQTPVKTGRKVSDTFCHFAHGRRRSTDPLRVSQAPVSCPCPSASVRLSVVPPKAGEAPRGPGASEFSSVRRQGRRECRSGRPCSRIGNRPRAARGRLGGRRTLKATSMGCRRESTGTRRESSRVGGIGRKVSDTLRQIETCDFASDRSEAKSYLHSTGTVPAHAHRGPVRSQAGGA